ncbi:DUF6691 family protein [Isoalcanivorax beigongshangi]|uniref:DUF6691 family protein n=1 Tax=Isoalcanivorax beigongshangi TaxID=3238810 RepID=A0ABV4AGF6_9GAMM
MKQLIVALVMGALFGAGLTLSGLSSPDVVLGFLDVFGDFNPALLIVMAVAVAITFLTGGLILRRGKPLLAESFAVPTRKDIDAPLIVGAVLFGIGWGLAGYCPGPIVIGLGAGTGTAWIFLPGMLAGMVIHQLWQRRGT